MLLTCGNCFFNRDTRDGTPAGASLLFSQSHSIRVTSFDHVDDRTDFTPYITIDNIESSNAGQKRKNIGECESSKSGEDESVKSCRRSTENGTEADDLQGNGRIDECAWVMGIARRKDAHIYTLGIYFTGHCKTQKISFCEGRSRAVQAFAVSSTQPHTNRTKGRTSRSFFVFGPNYQRLHVAFLGHFVRPEKHVE
jgi:hypothetical protein